MTTRTTESFRTQPAPPADSAKAIRYSRHVLGAMATLVVCIGMALCVLLPALNAPDEIYHWQRAVQISHGQFSADRRAGQDYGGEIDTAALEFAQWAKSHVERPSAFSLTQVRQISATLAESSGMVSRTKGSLLCFSMQIRLAPWPVRSSGTLVSYPAPTATASQSRLTAALSAWLHDTIENPANAGPGAGCNP